MTKKNARKKVKSKSSGGGTAVADDEDDDDLDLEDGIDEEDLEEEYEDDDDAEYEEDDDDEDADEDEDGDEDEEEEEEEDDEEEEPEASADDGDDDEDDDSSYSEGYDVLDYAPGDIEASIERDPDSPRVKEMVKSIKANGLLSPILIGSDAVIVAGNTRYAALVKMGAKEIPCRVAVDPKTGEQIESADYAAAMQSLAENINRSTITPLEQGRQFNELLKSKTVSDASEIARHLGISKTTVTKYANLAADVTDELADALENDRVTTDAAITILRRSKNKGETNEMLEGLLTASKGRKVSEKAATKAAQKSGKGKKSKRGRKATNRALSDEALATEESSISGTLKIDRESGGFTVRLVVDIDYDKETFSRFNIERAVQARLSKLDAKAVRAELEVAREALVND